MDREFDIVIAGQAVDPHVSSVVDCLGGEFSLLIVDRYAKTLADIDILDLDSTAKIKVYWKRDKGDITNSSNIKFEEFHRERYFDIAWKMIFDGFEELALSTFHSREQIEIASNKIRQLAVARRAGFTTPDTLYTNDVRAVSARFADEEKVLVKSIVSLGVNQKKALVSKTFTLPELEEKSEAFRMTPFIVQKYVPKDYELRVTVIGDDVFACKIDSQSDPRSAIDWRITQFRTGMYEAVNIDAALEKKLKEFLKILGLRYGVFDLIITPDHQTVFLECNIDGQWLFIEQFTGMKIASSFANLLANEVRAVSN